MDNNSYDVIIIGAGPGGSTIAALLAKAGWQVLLVDKNAVPGGKMLPVHKDGFDYEMFPINAVPSRNTLFEQLTQELELEDQIHVIYPNPVGRFYFELPTGEIRTLEMSDKTPSPFGFKRLLGLSWIGFFKFMRIFSKMISTKPDQLEKLAGLSALEYIDQQNLPKSLRSYLLSVYAEGFFQSSPDRLSAAAMIRAVQQTTKDGGGRYYIGGIGSVFVAFANAVERYGSRVLYNTRVEKILVEDGKVVGIKTANDQFLTPVVISSAGIQPTVLKLVGEDVFKPEYVTWVKDLEMNLASVGYRWFLNEPLLTSPMNIFLTYNSVTTLEDFRNMEHGIFPDHNYVYLGTTSLYPGLAPEGKQLVYACMSCLGDPKLDIKPYLQQVRNTVKKMQPDLFDHIEREETFGPRTIAGLSRDSVLPGKGGEDYGTLLSITQYGDPRLDGSSPIDGLYYVGCDAGGFGLGTHQAVDSAINVYQLVLESQKHK